MENHMLYRCSNWDYTNPCIYMITLVLADRSTPLLGKVVVDTPGASSPETLQAHLSPSHLGTLIFQIFQNLPNYYHQIKPLFLQLMEEHLHFILQVTQKLAKPLGHIIGGFKGDCTKVYRELYQIRNSLFAPGYQDTILFRKGQLQRMFSYIKDNPRRLAIKRLFPDLFHINRLIPFSSGHLTGVGNQFLLQSPSFHQLQMSRQIPIDSPEMGKALYRLEKAARNHAVVVSPCISPGEKHLAHQAFELQLPLIILRNNVFPPLYKPSGAYFDACAKGRLLIRNF